MDWMMNETEYREWCELSWEDRKARFLDGLFYGFAIPCDKSTADGGTIRSEKVLKFDRKAMRKIAKPPKEKKLSKRFKGGDDLMVCPVGQPGSPERLAALTEQYNTIRERGLEISPFREE